MRGNAPLLARMRVAAGVAGQIETDAGDHEARDRHHEERQHLECCHGRSPSRTFRPVGCSRSAHKTIETARDAPSTAFGARPTDPP